MQTLYVTGTSILAPGMSEATTITRVLQGQQDWQHAALPKLTAELLPANERRRTTALIKLAMQTLQGLLRENDNHDNTQMVFASSDGDLGIDNYLCQALNQPEKMLSPTNFHNSVANAPAGYWSIATGMQSASNSLSAADASFAAGLLEAATQCICDDCEVMLVAYDMPAPAPLDHARHFDEPVAIALLLSTRADQNALAAITINQSGEQHHSRCVNSSLDYLHKANPAAAGLPLLEALHRNNHCSIVLPYVRQQTITVEVRPL